MKRSPSVPLALTALLATSLTACASNEPEPDNYAICVDPATEERVADSNCGDSGGGGGSGLGGFAFLYFGGISGGRSYNVPGVGQSYRDSGGDTVRPQGRTQLGGVSPSGGTVAKGSSAVRGGFGSRGTRGSGG